MIPKNITEAHILQALQDIDNNGIKYPLTKSRKFDLVFNGKNYPPKYVISIANELANQVYLTHKAFSTYEAQSYLKNLSPKFIIEEKKEADPVLDLIEKYKIHLKTNGLNDEIFKWKLLAEFEGRPNVDVENFYEEIKNVKFDHLIYGVGIAVIYHLAKDKTEEYRACFKVLFDESKPLVERVKYFHEKTLKIYRELVSNEKYSHHQDERTIATFLTYHNPKIYTFFKDSFYQIYCKLLGIKAKSKGEKYVHYLELVDEFVVEYINEDKELLVLVNNLIPANAFQDNNHKLLAQDILYNTLVRF